MANSHITCKENNLKARLLMSKLNAVFSKRLERQKNNAFNQIKLNTVKLLSIERSAGEYANSYISSGFKNDKLMRGTTSDFRMTQSTYHGPGNAHNSGLNTANSSINRNSSFKRQHSAAHQLTSSLIGNMMHTEQVTIDNNIGLA
jgi:hypothetical protein